MVAGESELLGLAVDAAVPGGGGKGAIPSPLLSLAAAAAAADAYFNVWPVGIVGKGAGFMPAGAAPFVFVGSDVCNVASAGKGDFSCNEGLRAATLGGSG